MGAPPTFEREFEGNAKKTKADEKENEQCTKLKKLVEEMTFVVEPVF